MNRLGDATSPYLLQHAGNPVDWWPWSPEAFAEAKRRDVPVLISVGYAACHWCHVMAHESFEDESVARLMNQAFVNIKVDREERPDVDAVYMTATQAMTGQGGWPMTVFATPDGTPFYTGTYFPRPNFIGLLQSVATAWQDEREAVLHQGAAVVEAIGGAQAVGGPSTPLTADLLDAAADQLAKEYDSTNGGFGGAPKFPPHMNLLFLLRHHQRTGAPADLEIARHTAEAMARGGIYDQLAGGFARYSVDGHWTVPHFEKMLYDNALLLRVYTHLWRLTGDAMARRVADETAAFLIRDLGTPEGGFASALDADTAGVEGLTYAWTPAQLTEALGAEDGPFAADLFAVTDKGTFEHGTSVLRLARDVDDAAPEVVQRWRDVRDRLHAARAGRPQPARDDKVVAAWNGLAITALVEHAAATGAVESATAAVRAATLLSTLHVVDGRLRRVSRDGAVGEPAGVLEDYGAVAEAFCAVHQATGEGRWLDAAGDARRHGAGPVRRRLRRLLRHRRRRRGADRPPGRPDRQRDPVRPVRARRRAHRLRRAAGRAALPRGGRGRAGHRRADRRPPRPLHRVRRRDRRGAAVRAVRGRDRGRRRRVRRRAVPGRPPARAARRGRGRRPPRPTGRAAPGRPAAAGRASHRVRLPRFRLRPAGDHGRRAGRPARPRTGGLSRLVRLAPRWIPGPVCPLSAWWAEASWPA